MKSAQAPLPLVETFPIDCFYEDGISSINLPLIARRIIAVRHLEGDKDYSLSDIAKELIERE
jgi:hypothetical protein